MKKQKKKVTVILTGIIIGLLVFFFVKKIFWDFPKTELSGIEEKLPEEVQNKEQSVEIPKKIPKEMPEEMPKKMPEVQKILSEGIAPGTEQGENWAVSVYRMKDDVEEHAGSQESMQAASLIKLYIMGAVYERYEELIEIAGKESVDGMLHRMITISDNGASNALTKLLGEQDAEKGREAVNEYCRRHGYQDTTMGRMLMESSENGDNYTSVRDCSRFLKRVYRKESHHAEEMLELLKQQERCGKIPAGVPVEVETANKTGELADVENDVALVFAGENPYILCIMSEHLQSPSRARQTILQLSSDIYETMK